MKPPVAPTLRAIFVAFAMLLAGADPAHAESRAPAGLRSLGIVPSGPITAVAAAPPSKENALGTILVAWCDDPFGAPAVRVGEWSLEGSRWIDKAIVRRVQLCPETVRMVWSRPRLVLALGYDGAGTTELIVLRRDGARLDEVHAVTYDNAEAPSLDADERFIALATYERRKPLVAGTERTAPPFHGLHVRLFDPATMQLVAARVFCGPHLLRRHTQPEAAGHAVRFLGGHLFVAVADDDPRVVATRLPSLATEVERTFPVPQSLRTPSSASIVLNRMGEALVVGVDATYVLSPKLDVIAKHAAPIANPIAYDTSTRGVLATDGEPATLDGWRVRRADAFARKAGPYSVDGEPLGVLYAHGHGILFGALAPPRPARTAPSTWAIRVLP